MSKLETVMDALMAVVGWVKRAAFPQWMALQSAPRVSYVESAPCSGSGQRTRTDTFTECNVCHEVILARGGRLSRHGYTRTRITSREVA